MVNVITDIIGADILYHRRIRSCAISCSIQDLAITAERVGSSERLRSCWFVSLRKKMSAFQCLNRLVPGFSPSDSPGCNCVL